MRFRSTAKVLAECKLKYYRISERLVKELMVLVRLQAATRSITRWPAGGRRAASADSPEVAGRLDPFLCWSSPDPAGLSCGAALALLVEVRF